MNIFSLIHAQVNYVHNYLGCKRQEKQISFSQIATLAVKSKQCNDMYAHMPYSSTCESLLVIIPINSH